MKIFSLLLLLIFKGLIFTFSVFVFSNAYACKTNNDKENIIILRSFFDSILSENQSLEEVSETHRYKGRGVKNKNEANTLFTYHIDYIKSEKKQLIQNKVDLTITKYKECTLENKWKFEKKDLDDIYVVSVNGMIETYVLMKKDRILSLVYFRKGSDNTAHFIPYYVKSTYQ
ncbi:hypothetical protein [Aquimarina sp. RZ0]|uniref:hypothetical protein n=1 Tax=Aquimarina sp. RZ0 TaxID=2607730 RepID=UPI0011F3448C|nr:hypothetical protein [Aquimarina sp. RZ0]KAA1243382.1 hypothetical protein F0000_21225 [Aquimarina sp. RZ0]